MEASASNKLGDCITVDLVFMSFSSRSPPGCIFTQVLASFTFASLKNSLNGLRSSLNNFNLVNTSGAASTWVFHSAILFFTGSYSLPSSVFSNSFILSMLI